MSNFEVLSPAGDMASLVAAVRVGADAVYLGSDSFSARAGAANFAGNELAEAVNFAHLRGVKVYLALNTLIGDNEFSAAKSLLQTACVCGIDAVIVQDFGVCRLINAVAPAMPIHASTQMSVTSPAGIRTLYSSGFNFRRVVLARELCRNEIAACTKYASSLSIETEVFVHGALCMSLSGSCYISASLGGLSANRGRCAGACRLPFSVNDDKDNYHLSLKDLCLLDYVDDLKSIGVTSLKIEGRMKRPEYVALATHVYRKAADGDVIDTSMLTLLNDVFSRSGFTDGYYNGRPDRKMFGIRTETDAGKSSATFGKIHELYRHERQSVPVSFEISCPSDEITLTLCDGENHVTVHSPAGNNDDILNPAIIEALLRKTGGTPFFTKSVNLNGKHFFISRSEINALKSAALSALTDKRSAVRPVLFYGDLPIREVVTPTPLPFKRLVRLSSINQMPDILENDTFFSLPVSEFIMSAAASQEQLIIELPRAEFAPYGKVESLCRSAAKSGVKYALCNSLAGISAAKAAGLLPICSPFMNIFNTESTFAYRDMGCFGAVLSSELRKSAVADIRKSAPIPVGLMTYGYLPLMLTRNCPINNRGGCGKCTNPGLIDRKEIRFPIVCGKNGYSEVLNSRPLWLFDIKGTDFDLEFFNFLYFTVESKRDVKEILDMERMMIPTTSKFTRGLYTKGVL